MKRLLLMQYICFSALCAQELPEPYRTVRCLPFDNHGWLAKSNQIGLDRLIRELNPTSVIELGSWLGSSTRFIAERLQQGARLYAVDNWSPISTEDIRRTEGCPERLPTLYQQFLSNVIHKGLCHVIIPVRMDTREASRSLDVMAELIYVDAAHGEEDVYQDVSDWYPHLKEGGIMCGDDWWSEDVRKGVRRAAREVNQVIHSEGIFWWLDPK